VRTTTESLLAGLQTAKAEAVARNARVRFQLVDSLGGDCVVDARGANWVVNLDPSNDPEAIEGACDAEPSDTDAPRIVLTRPASESAGSVQVEASAATLVFNGLGRLTPVPAGDVTIDVSNPSAGDCAAEGGEITCLRIVVSPAGQIRMCNPKFDLPDPQGC
jgi:type IV fimbrial biogenesis protein FimT